MTALRRRTPPSQLYTNVMVLVGHGYAVLLPSVPAVSRPNGGHYPFTAQILSAVDAAVATGRVDPHRLGLFGHSFGSFTVATVATQTSRFNAIVASSGTYDLVSQRGIFTPWTRLNPGEGQSIGANGGWAETGQAMLGTTPWGDPQAYVAASPVFHADKITTPILIQSADADFASLQQGEELYSALARQGKDAELVTYWGEGHVPVSPANLRDYYARVLAWFDEHLTRR
jgi:dipeptidyl aminopeptidase/acylaminoacyl peptidase